MKIKDLMERYGLKSRQSIYDWCKAANLELAKDSRNRKYAEPEQIVVLDDLKTHLDNGASLKDYTPLSSVELDNQIDTLIDSKLDTKSASLTSTVQPSVDSKLDTKSAPLTNTVQSSVDSKLDTLNLTPELLGEMVGVISQQLQPSDPLWYHERLESAMAGGWLLTTAEVKALIGVTPAPKKGGNSYIRGRWKFTKAGKIGGSTAWEITKENPKDRD